jgi:hypothetical protein
MQHSVPGQTGTKVSQDNVTFIVRVPAITLKGKNASITLHVTHRCVFQPEKISNLLTLLMLLNPYPANVENMVSS